MNGARNGTIFLPLPLGPREGSKRSNIIEFQLQSQFQVFLRGYLSKALTCMKVFLYKQELFFLSRRQIPLATLLYEKLIHIT